MEYLNIVLEEDGQFICFEDDLGREIQIGRKELDRIRISGEELAELGIVQDQVEDQIDNALAEKDYEDSKEIEDLHDKLKQCILEKEDLEKQLEEVTYES